jgi:hypothetical protein
MLGCISVWTGVKRKGGGVSTHNLLTPLEGLEVFAFMALMALVFGLQMMISARDGESGWAWFWALVFVMASLLADLTFLRLS